ncbi:MAG: hypothetical protein J6R45_00850 [Clostridia bacterium]|nr:hypothetical protein [Clostridia bacterium]
MVVIYWLLQLSWGLLQSLIGFVLFLINVRRKHYFYKGAIITEWAQGGGISLGLFVFVEQSPREFLVKHEYGHTLQSLMLGPLYIAVIGIPSFIWANLPYFRKKRKAEGISYYSLYCEKWANALGGAEQDK